HTHTHTHTTQTPHSCVLRKQKLPLHSFKHFLVICHVWHSVCVCVRERVCACSFCECGDIRDSVHVCVSLGHTIVCVLVYVPGVCVCVCPCMCVCVCVCVRVCVSLGQRILCVLVYVSGVCVCVCPCMCVCVCVCVRVRVSDARVF